MYVDAMYDKDKNQIKVVERNSDGNRIYLQYAPDYSFYVEDPNGDYTSMFRTKCKKITPKTNSDLKKELAAVRNKKTFEADCKPLFRCLEQNYLDAESPKLNIAFYDIESDYDEDLGYSDPNEALNRITSISLYLSWIKKMVCIAVPPDSMSFSEANDIANEVGDTIIVENEAMMLSLFLELIDDADILSGWNSDSYDLPYIVHRITKVLGKNETRKLCLWNQLPSRKDIEVGNKIKIMYNLTGRISLDYLELYKKYCYEERHSYKLDSIAELELDENKVAYEGTLDELYNEDFKKFLEYNIHDTRLLVKLDEKLKYIDLVNKIAHENCVLLPTTQGAVATTEQAIIIEAHKRGFVVQNRARGNSSEFQAAGGWVQTPKKGLHKWVASVDLNSLYPSVIRAFNMSPETIIGQIDMSLTNDAIRQYISAKKANTFSEWWEDRFNILEMEYFYKKDPAERLHVNFVNGERLEITGAELHDLIFDDNLKWCITANGTIVRTDVEGIIPGLLSGWYSDRKRMQTINKYLIKLTEIYVGADITHKHDFNYRNIINIDIHALDKAIQNKDYDNLKILCEKYGINIIDGYLSPVNKDMYHEATEYWDKRQHVKKIMLNSLYGGLLNEGNRFYLFDIGQSTTLSGRTISCHMTSKINEIITGKYEIYGESQIYGDTDSEYFTIYPMLKDKIDSGEITWDNDTIIKLYDDIVPIVNDSFAPFLKEKLNVPLERSEGVIKCGREIVAVSGLFLNKKKYAALVIDKEGKRKDVKGKPGEVKVTGLDLRRADTPKEVQDFLFDILLDTLNNGVEEQIIKKIKIFKEAYSNKKSWEKGSPKAVKGLGKYYALLDERNTKLMNNMSAGKVNMPGHVKASINWNRLLDMYNDRRSTKIVDGSKIIVCSLKENNELGMRSIAYPVDINRLPDWFLTLPFNEEKMEETIIDNKIDNMLGVLKWDFSKASKQHDIMSRLFDF